MDYPHRALAKLTQHMSESKPSLQHIIISFALSMLFLVAGSCAHLQVAPPRVLHLPQAYCGAKPLPCQIEKPWCDPHPSSMQHVPPAPAARKEAHLRALCNLGMCLAVPAIGQRMLYGRNESKEVCALPFLPGSPPSIC